jgi:hypothetical protein
MKKILILLLLFAVLSANAQTDTTGVQTDSVEIQIITLPDSTAIGAPDGKSVSKEIGLAGGKIVSYDGRVELIFPAGALSINTPISIQPIVNLIPNGNGKAYRFEPSGTRFLKPVELIFHYTQEEGETCPPYLKFMAIQSSNGKWEYMDYEDWDSASGILKGRILHFSDMVNGNLAALTPDKVTLKVGEKLNFILNIVQPPATRTPSSGDTDEDELPPLPSLAPLGKEKTEWSVNGKEGGSEKFGKITRGNQSIATYSTPVVMTDAPITVGLKTYFIYKTEKTTRSGKRKGKMISMDTKREYLATFASTVHLWDQYKITITEKGLSVLECRAELEDISDLTVKLYPDKVEFIGDPINRPPTLTKQANCKNRKYDPNGCQGPVDIKKSQLEQEQYKISNDGIITIKFLPHPVKIMNNTGKFQNEIVAWEEGFDISSVEVINFKANRQTQNIKTGRIEFKIIPD